LNIVICLIFVEGASCGNRIRGIDLLVKWQQIFIKYNRMD